MSTFAYGTGPVWQTDVGLLRLAVGNTGQLRSNLIADTVPGDVLYAAGHGPLLTSTTGPVRLTSDLIPPLILIADNIVNAVTLVGAGQVTYSLEGLTTETGEQDAYGDPPEEGGIAHSAWWKFTAGGDGQVEFDTEQSLPDVNNDTIIAVFTAATTPVNDWTDLTPVVFNDDAGEGYTSRCKVAVTEGETYWVQVYLYSNPITEPPYPEFILRWTDIDTPAALVLERRRGALPGTESGANGFEEFSQKFNISGTSFQCYGVDFKLSAAVVSVKVELLDNTLATVFEINEIPTVFIDGYARFLLDEPVVAPDDVQLTLKVTSLDTFNAVFSANYTPLGIYGVQDGTYNGGTVSGAYAFALLGP